MNQIDMLGRKALAFGCSVAYEEPMSRHTTFKIGGSADLFVTAHNVAMLSDFLRIFGRCTLRYPPARRTGARMRGGWVPGGPL